ncbi:MAG TPA: hypothetical protein VNX21_06130, partial [Candidatus Thermoplasmatota archaeon]|nr:hypothetical protein [Candidatus Thermoplasmatota archaeon]
MSPRIGQVEVQPAQGLIGALDINIEIRNDQTRWRVVDSRGTLVILDGSTAIDVASSRQVWPEATLDLHRGGDSQIGHRFSLTSEQVFAIETIRKGGRANFRIFLNLMAFNMDSNMEPGRLTLEKHFT